MDLEMSQEGMPSLPPRSDSPAVRPRRPSRKNDRSDEIAIIGMAGMFPKARSVRDFWANICNRVFAIEDVPQHRWNEEDFFSPERLKPDQVYSKWGAFLKATRFNPMDWQMPPASLHSIDTVQLLSLDIAWQALVDSGYHHKDCDRSKFGVIFAAAGSHDVGTDYCFRTMMRHYLPRATSLDKNQQSQVLREIEATLPEWTEDTFAGFLLNVISGRIANRMNFGGVNFTVDAACAASLAALDAAVGQLRLRTADVMLLGAADVTNNPFCYMSFAKTHALSPKGVPRPFDASADGIALGETVAGLMLKRLPDAERDGDKIYAVIKGMGRSSDGRNRSMTAPHPPGQMLAMQRAYEDAGVTANSLTLIEAHGTGTVVGDGSEVTALTSAFKIDNYKPKSVAIGSVKSMIGHAKTAAGVASLVKTALALKHRVLPPTIGVETPNDKLNTPDSPFFVNTETRPWLRANPEIPRRAGVSAFGFGGTNFHVVLEEYDGPNAVVAQDDFTPRGVEVFYWQADSQDELIAKLASVRSRLADVDLEDVQTSDFAELALAVWRDRSPDSAPAAFRLGLVAATIAELIEHLDQLTESFTTAVNRPGVHYSSAPAVDPTKVCFLYPGQGAQRLNMLRELAIAFPESRELADLANSTLRQEFPDSLTRCIYPPTDFEPGAVEAQQKALNSTRVAQPALAFVELFATDLLRRFGVTPAIAAGHSFGEYLALYAAGSLTAEDMLKVVGARGRLMAETAESCSGAMAAVLTDAATTQSWIERHGLAVVIANYNTPSQMVISGTVEEIERAVKLAAEDGIGAKRLAVSGAFHSSQMEEASRQFAKILKDIPFRAPGILVSSNTTAQVYPAKPAAMRELLARHLVEPVRFVDQVSQLVSAGVELFVEVGPGKILTRMVEQNLSDKKIPILTLDGGKGGVPQFAEMLAACLAFGLPVNLSAWFAGRELSERSIADYFDQLCKRQRIGVTDWILTPGHARPAKQGVTISEAIRHAIEEEAAVVQNRLTRRDVDETRGLETAIDAGTVYEHELTDVDEILADDLLESDDAALPFDEPVPVAEWSAADVEPRDRPRGFGFGKRLSAERHVANGSLVTSSPASSAAMSVLNREETMHSSNGHQDPVTNGNGAAPHGDRADKVLTIVSQFLELQTAQQRMLDRLLTMHDQAAQHAPATGMNGLAAVTYVEPTRPAAYVTAAPAAPAARPEPTVSAVARVKKAPPRPAPPAQRLSPKPVEAPAVERRVSAPAPAPAPVAKVAPAPAPVKAPVPAAAPASAPAGDVPSSEVFRQDLLQAVAERTGYPVDALDETLQLESGLGIDSIKTIEIFSKLKSYHSVFRVEGEDEEELMGEFSRLKTLGDIVQFYDDRRSKKLASGGGAASGPEVERHVLTAHDASGDSSKKKPSH